MTYDAVDLFAGPGGWDVAARRASGLPTVQGDVREVMWALRNMIVAGLIASPPCQTFSAAGNGSGRKALSTVLALVRRMGRREIVDMSLFEDERTGLVLEPLRWALFARDYGRPFEWIALEQVPAVLPVWEAMADVLRAEGYSVVTGKLSAEEYGVPQTRVRAFLAARRDGKARLPAPTHRKYRKGVAQHEGDTSLLPWVSMAEALGWGMIARPSMSVTGGGTATGGAEPFGNGARKSMHREFSAGRWSFRTSTIPHAALRTEHEPAPTIAFGNDANSARWFFERPATTIQGDARVGHPGHKCMTEDCHPGSRTTKQFDTGSVRVTIEEAAALQSFPTDHQWRGTKTKIYQQIGNAVPPLLAQAVLSAATAVEEVTCNVGDAVA